MTIALDPGALQGARALHLHSVEGERAVVEDGAVACREQFHIAQLGSHPCVDGKDAHAVARARAGVAAAEDDGLFVAAVDDHAGWEDQPLGQQDRDRCGGALAAVEGDQPAAGHRSLEGGLRATGRRAVADGAGGLGGQEVDQADGQGKNKHDNDVLG